MRETQRIEHLGTQENTHLPHGSCFMSFVVERGGLVSYWLSPVPALTDRPRYDHWEFLLQRGVADARRITPEHEYLASATSDVGTYHLFRRPVVSKS